MSITVFDHSADAESPPFVSSLRPLRVVAFIDGQNLYRAALTAYGSSHKEARYDVLALAESVAASQQMGVVTDVYFYTGIHSTKKPALREFWLRKLAAMGRQTNETGATVHPWSRQLQYTREETTRPDGTKDEWFSGHEKGVDIRLALDMIRVARQGKADSMILFSQDQDFVDAVREARMIYEERGEQLTVTCAYPVGKSSPTRTRGVIGTVHAPISREQYEQCLDRRSFWPPRQKQALAVDAPAQAVAAAVQHPVPTIDAVATIEWITDDPAVFVLEPTGVRALPVPFRPSVSRPARRSLRI